MYNEFFINTGSAYLFSIKPHGYFIKYDTATQGLGKCCQMYKQYYLNLELQVHTDNIQNYDGALNADDDVASKLLD